MPAAGVPVYAVARAGPERVKRPGTSPPYVPGRKAPGRAGGKPAEGLWGETK